MSTTSDVDAEMRYQKRSIRELFLASSAGPISVVFSVVLFTCIAVALAIPDTFFFLSEANVRLVLRAIPNFGIVALGVGILMIAGEFDLSVGSVYVVAPFGAAFALAAGVPLPLAIIVCFAIAAIVGLANAFVTIRFGIPSFITTLGMLFVVRAVAPYMAGYRRSVVIDLPEWFQTLFTGRIGFMPAQFLWFLVIALLAHLFLTRHRLGNHIFAVGGDAHSARAAGVDVARTKTLAFVICSMMAALAGLFQVVRLENAATNPQLFIELFAVAICVMGGLSLFGGRGTIIGIVLGAALLQVVQDIIILVRLPGFYLDMFVGSMIVVGVVLNQSLRKRY